MSSVESGGARPDRTTIHAAVAVRSADGFYFGTACWVEDRRLLIELDAELAVGEPLDVRLTLAPTPSTALLRAVAVRTLVTAPRETPRHLVGIREVHVEDRERFASWLHHVRTKGTFSSFDSVMGAAAQPSTNQSSEDVRRALDRLAHKPPATSTSAPTDPFGVRSDVFTAPPGAPGGRSAVRDALRSAIARSGAGRPADGAPGRLVASAPPAPLDHRLRPPPPPTPAPAASATPPAPPPAAAPRSTPPAPPWESLRSVPPGAPGVVRIGSARSPSDAPRSTPPPSTPPAERSPLRDPVYSVSVQSSATWLEVRWNDPGLFARDARLQLCNRTLSLVRVSEPLPDREPLRMLLRHGSLQLACPAGLRAIGPGGATYRLDLAPTDIELLRRWIVDQGKK